VSDVPECESDGQSGRGVQRFGEPSAQIVMGRNGTDDDVPAGDMASALAAPEQAKRGEEPCPVRGPELRLEVRRARLLRVASQPRGRIGRPTRLTPRLAKALVKLIAQTGRIEPAARRCGIPPSTVTDWIARGQGRHPTRAADHPFVEFAAAVEKALGKFECDQLAGIQAAAAAKPENWTARAWSLERWAPDRYGRRNRVDVAGMVTLVEVRALLEGVVNLIERYVPEQRREVEIANLFAVAKEIAGPELTMGR